MMMIIMDLFKIMYKRLLYREIMRRTQKKKKKILGNLSWCFYKDKKKKKKTN